MCQGLCYCFTAVLSSTSFPRLGGERGELALLNNSGIFSSYRAIAIASNYIDGVTDI